VVKGGNAEAAMADVTTAAGGGSMGLLKLLEQADNLSIAVLVVLSAMSLASWFVMLTRLWEQRLIARAYAQAQKKFWASGNPWDGMAALSGRDNVFRMLVEDGIRAAQHYEGRLAQEISLNDWITVSLYRSIESVTNRLVNGLNVLATTGSVSPFVGLLGTVWGIYNALNRISLSGDTSIEHVAGPIGEALIMTAIGLFVAVPAVIGYNWLIRRNKKLHEKMKQFAADLHTYLVGGKRIDMNAPLQRTAIHTPARQQTG
jgi:biopolymer transport protein ExbB